MIKTIRSSDYNYNFDTITGFFVRWGKTLNDNPLYSPFGPEILDIEVTTSCKGPNGRPCPFCYKANTPAGKNMSFNMFKQILDKMPNNLTQVAFGADAQATANKELFDMMNYCRNNNKNKVVPNITVADIDDNTAYMLATLCGAICVSRYADKNICYNSVERLTSLAASQVNIHQLISQETLDMTYETLQDYMDDKRIKNINAIVLLSLKQKGRGVGFTPLTASQFDALIKFIFKNNIPVGFDSCTSAKFLDSIKGHKFEKALTTLVEPCESFGMFSAYISVDGLWYPCSFLENEHKDFPGIDVINCNDFMNDIWNNEITTKWRNYIIEQRKKQKYECPIFNV